MNQIEMEDKNLTCRMQLFARGIKILKNNALSSRHLKVDAMTAKQEIFHHPTPKLFPLIKSIIKFIFHLGFDFKRQRKL